MVLLDGHKLSNFGLIGFQYISCYGSMLYKDARCDMNILFQYISCYGSIQKHIYLGDP